MFLVFDDGHSTKTFFQPDSDVIRPTTLPQKYASLGAETTDFFCVHEFEKPLTLHKTKHRVWKNWTRETYDT
jgi:hypothetical protein